MGRRRKKKYDKTVYRSLTLITQFGINMLVPIGMLTGLGIWLDGKAGTFCWTIVLFFVGAVAGGQNVYRMAKAIYDPDGSSKPAGNRAQTDRYHETRIKECDEAHEDREPTPTDFEK